MPDYDAILESIVTNGEIVAPRIRQVLDEVGAVPGKVCVLTFSQGAGPGLVFADRMPEGYVKVVDMVSGSYVETPQSALRPGYFIRKPDIRAVTILPIGDIVPTIIGLTPAGVIEASRKAFGANSEVWTKKVKGKHALDGAVADFAIKRAIRIMKEPARRNRPRPRALLAIKAA